MVIKGGLYLTANTAGPLQRVANVYLSKMPLPRVYPTRCRGEAAFVPLTNVIGPFVVHHCPAGAELDLEA